MLVLLCQYEGYHIDSGGQGAFLDVVSAILCNSPVNILTQKFNEKLETKLKCFFDFKGHMTFEPYGARNYQITTN